VEALIIHSAGFHQATEEGANRVQRVSHPTFKIRYRSHSSVEKFCDRKDGERREGKSEQVRPSKQL